MNNNGYHMRLNLGIQFLLKKSFLQIEFYI